VARRDHARARPLARQPPGPVRRLWLLPAVLLCLGLSGCGEDAPDAPPAAGRYALDREDFARRLAAERLDQISKVTKVIPLARRREVQETAIKQARALALSVELRADGAFLARYGAGKTAQRLAGSWTQRGATVAFETTQAPGGRVATVAPVEARRTADGLLFDKDASGWAVPHAFLLRRVE
jgi:hypothetical protein